MNKSNGSVEHSTHKLSMRMEIIVFFKKDFININLINASRAPHAADYEKVRQSNSVRWRSSTNCGLRLRSASSRRTSAVCARNQHPRGDLRRVCLLKQTTCVRTSNNCECVLMGTVHIENNGIIFYKLRCLFLIGSLILFFI